jgi:hypothetical protein
MMCEIYRFSPFFRAPLINSSPRRMPSRAQEPGSRFLKDMDSGFRRNDGIGNNQSLLSCLRIYESSLVFELRHIISTVSFRAKARNLVSLLFITSFCQIFAQSGIKYVAQNDMAMRASVKRDSVWKLSSVIRILVRSSARPFSLREKARMRERKYIFIRSPHPIPLPEGEGVLSRLLGRAFCRAEERL